MDSKRNARLAKRTGKSRIFYVRSFVWVNPQYSWEEEEIATMFRGCVMGSIGVEMIRSAANELPRVSA